MLIHPCDLPSPEREWHPQTDTRLNGTSILQVLRRRGLPLPPPTLSELAVAEHAYIPHPVVRAPAAAPALTEGFVAMTLPSVVCLGHVHHHCSVDSLELKLSPNYFPKRLDVEDLAGGSSRN